MQIYSQFWQIHGILSCDLHMFVFDSLMSRLIYFPVYVMHEVSMILYSMNLICVEKLIWMF